MKILLLGAGSSQLNAVNCLKMQGHTVIVSDYYDNPPGKLIADVHEKVSTFDIEGNIAIAKKHQVDGIMTLGTDQPVYTVARVAEALNLPFLLETATAKAVTNKKIMKETFIKYGIPTLAYSLIKKDFHPSELKQLQFPVVVKPVDSQGQRGVYKLDTINEIQTVIPEVLGYSREDHILVEEYYPNDEITVSGWVINGQPYIISIVDRISFKNFPHIGICVRHGFPSKHLQAYFKEISEITARIVQGFQIQNGPIYFQMLIGAEGVKVNEIACRLGGAYEDEYLLEATGIDLLGMLIAATLGQSLNTYQQELQQFDLLKTATFVSVELFFAGPCVIHSLNDMEKLKNLPGVIQARHNFKPGDRIGEMVNATQRAGFVIIKGDSTESLAVNMERVYRNLAVIDETGCNKIIQRNGLQ